jgi:hypothetical protein
MKIYLINKKTELEAVLERMGKEMVKTQEYHRQALTVAVSTFTEVNSYVESTSFPNAESEIYYFKNACPYLLSEIFYHQLSLSYFTKKEQFTTARALKQFCKGKIRSIKEHFETYHDILCYCASGHSNRDSEFFLQKSSPNPILFDESLLFLGSTPLSGYSIILGRSMAYYRMKKMFRNDMQKSSIDPKSTESVPSRKTVFSLDWTAQKVNLVELAYALHAENCFNQGECDIAQIMKYLEQVFNVSVGNFYDTYSDIRARKCPTQFLSRLQEKLTQKINSLEQISTSSN